MKVLFFVLSLFACGTSVAQEDSTIALVQEDTSAIYVINNTNRLIKVGDYYLLEFRDLRTISMVQSIRFDSKENVETFIADCYKVLDQNTTVVREQYKMNRNVLSKFVVRIEQNDEAYFLLAYGTLEKMEKAFKRHLKSE